MTVRFSRLHKEIVQPKFDVFIEELKRKGDVRMAAEAAGIRNIPDLYMHRQLDPKFAALWDAAIALYKAQVSDFIFTEAVKQAMSGSERLLIIFLKRFHPEFREEKTVNLNKTQRHELLAGDVRNSIRNLTDDELHQLNATITKLGLNVPTSSSGDSVLH